MILWVGFASIAMSLVDGVLQPSYLYKSLIKMVLFLLVPMGYFLADKSRLVTVKNLFIPRKKDFLFGLSLGIGVYAFIMGAYFILKDHIDLSAIQASLTSGVGVNQDNFLWVSLYIAFVNSLLEEFFFRGIGFIVVKERVSRLFAYGFSPLMFALYHVGMTSGWFHWGIYLLALAGLFAGGCVFNFLNEKRGNIYCSWFVHMCANFAINTVGLILFGII